MPSVALEECRALGLLDKREETALDGFACSEEYTTAGAAFAIVAKATARRVNWPSRVVNIFIAVNGMKVNANIDVLEFTLYTTPSECLLLLDCELSFAKRI